MYTRYLNISFHLCALALKMCATRNRATIKNGVAKQRWETFHSFSRRATNEIGGGGKGGEGERDLIGENRGW